MHGLLAQLGRRRHPGYPQTLSDETNSCPDRASAGKGAPPARFDLMPELTLHEDNRRHERKEREQKRNPQPTRTPAGASAAHASTGAFNRSPLGGNRNPEKH